VLVTLKWWFSTFLLKGAKSRPTILLESYTKNFTHMSIDIFKQGLLDTILAFSLKDCREPHKGYLGVRP